MKLMDGLPVALPYRNKLHEGYYLLIILITCHFRSESCIQLVFFFLSSPHHPRLIGAFLKIGPDD